MNDNDRNYAAAVRDSRRTYITIVITFTTMKLITKLLLSNRESRISTIYIKIMYEKRHIVALFFFFYYAGDSFCYPAIAMSWRILTPYTLPR